MRRTAIASILAVVMLLPVVSGCLSGDDAGSKKSIDVVKIQAEAKVTAVYPGTYKFDGAYSQVLAPGALKPLPPVQTFIKSKLDGADIEIGYHLPEVADGVKVPVIVDASPYHRVSGSVISLRGMLLFLHDNFLPHGYAVAGVSVRGTGNSGGCMDLMGKKEVADMDQAITWLAEQPWSNGNVAMIGVSYDGSTPWDVAATGNPALKTIVPISGLPDIFGLMYRNGSAESRGALLVNALYYTYGPSPDDVLGATNPQNQRTAIHRVEGTACADYPVGLVGAGWSTVMGDRDPTGYWAERNRKPLIEKNYRGSILLVQGLQDWNVDPSLVIPWVNVLNESGAPLKQMLGQWGHMSPDRQMSRGVPAPYTRYDWAEILLHWFDKYLKEIPNVDTGPAVQIQDHTFRWRNEGDFPPRDAAWSALHLSTANKLAPEAGSAGSVLLLPQPAAETQPFSNLRSVPGYAADFATAPLLEPLQISGLPRLHVTVTPHGPTGHLAAFLYDVDDKGAEKRIGWTTMNLQFADGTEKSRPITPNQPLLAKMEFQPLDAYLLAGHQLRVRIWEYQDADRLPAIPPEPVTVNFGGSTKSVLELPIVARGPEAFFQPPMPAAKT